MGEHLQNAPLVEALLELKWALHQDSEAAPLRDLAYPTIIGLLYGQVKNDYPFIERLPQSILPAEVIPSLPTHRFRKGENEWPLIQIGPGIATLNFTVSYSWETFQSAALRLANDFMSSYESAVTNPPLLQQITLRYINAIPFQFKDQDVYDFLESKLHVILQFPTMMTESLSNGQTEYLNLQVNYRLAKPAGIGALTIGRGEKQGKPTLVWDLAIASFGTDVPNLTGLSSWLSEAHSVLQNWFLTLVHGDLLESFKGGE